MVFADGRNYDTAKKLKDSIPIINISSLLYRIKLDSTTNFTSYPRANDTAYLFHTPGTSTGLPKPIPLSHHAAVRVLPRLPGGNDHSIFSTTPLYHGGIADCLQAWMSGATIHLFPGTQSISSSKILCAVDRANAYMNGTSPIKYFASVPYILQMLSDDSDTPGDSPGLRFLQGMELVGVGSPALPQAVGDYLVSKGVNLILRFRSAECGFLLSSHRDYAIDQEWSYLRSDPLLQPEYYDFEAQNSHENDSTIPLFELIVKQEWPHRGKANRPDGSFATADLFEQHPTIPNAWRYHSRADAQITLVNGTKFDPTPVETKILCSEAGRRILGDAMVFGTGREVPGVLLVPKWGIDFVSDDQVIDNLWPTIKKMNNQAQNHARLRRASLVVARGKERGAEALPKSSKGTVLRREAESIFTGEIEEAYGDEHISESDKHDAPNTEIMDELTKLFDNVLGRRISPTDDLFAQGVDSLACSRVRKSISQRFFSETDISLPLNLLYEQGSIEHLSSYIERCHSSGSEVGKENATSDEQLMLDLVEKYQHPIQTPTGSFNHQEERAVVLTGATGFLGAHILGLMLRDPKVSKVFCLVRAPNSYDATEKVLVSLRSQGLDEPGLNSCKMTCIPSFLYHTRLGLSESEWNVIADEATMIIHASWTFDFNLKLRSFEDQLAGLYNLLELRDATRGSAARLVFLSSTCAVSSAERADHPVEETVSSEPDDAPPSGYSRSKWVAENICASARVGGSFSLPVASTDATHAADEKFPVVVMRVGQLSGNKHGIWDKTEAYPTLLASAKITGCLPDLPHETLSWIPVDVAAEAVLELSFLGGIGKPGRAGAHQRTPVYHIVNPHQELAWSDMLEWIQQPEGLEENGGNGVATHSTGPAGHQGFKMVSPSDWLKTLEEALEKRRHPARYFLHHWQRTYSQYDGNISPSFNTYGTEKASEVLREVEPLGPVEVMRMWKWIQSNF